MGRHAKSYAFCYFSKILVCSVVDPETVSNLKPPFS